MVVGCFSTWSSFGVYYNTCICLAAKKYKLSKSEIVKLAVEKYIAHEDLRALRNTLVPFAEKAGYLTDEDIFKTVS